MTTASASGVALSTASRSCTAVPTWTTSTPAGRFDDDGAAAAQRRHVLLGGRVFPHLGVHGGREDDRTAGGQERVREQVVGQAVSGLREDVRGRRGDDDQVGVLPDADVRDL